MSHGVNHPSIVEGNGFKNNDKDILSSCGHHNFDKKYIYIYFTYYVICNFFFFSQMRVLISIEIE